jgi:tetratricopeptide (TPR) repeat protein
MQTERTSLSLVKVGILAVAFSLGGTLAFAASGGGSSGGGSSTPSCPKGEVWNSHQGKCAKSTSSLDDKQLYTQGRDLALAGRYAEALTALEAVKNQNDAMVLTMIGYSKRKLGNTDEGLAFYQRALAIDPNNVNTHEYLGEAYAEKGKLDLAKAELVKVAAVCGTTCEQYQDLAKAIAGTPSGT